MFAAGGSGYNPITGEPFDKAAQVCYVNMPRMFWHHCLHCRLIKYPSLIMITFCKDFQNFD